MNCQRYKPAEFKYVTPVGKLKQSIFKGVPQIDMSLLEVSESFHAAPAHALSHEMLVNYPPEDTPFPDREPRFHKAFQSLAPVQAHDFVCNHQELTDLKSASKSPIKSVKHKGQRILG